MAQDGGYPQKAEVQKDVAGLSDPAELKKRGNEAYARKQYADAICYYTRALECQSNEQEQAVYLSNRSICRRCSGQVQAALEDALEVIKRRPDWVKGHVRQAQALMALERFDEADAALEEASKSEFDLRSRAEIDECRKEISSKLSPFKDLSPGKDGSILMKLIKPGDGTLRAGKLATCFVHFRLKDMSDQVISSSRAQMSMRGLGVGNSGKNTGRADTSDPPALRTKGD
jgi:tetratricopeptide (TPR) repeat protein